MGKGIVEKIISEFPAVEVEWLGYELHPETPAGGVALSKLFPGLDQEAMLSRLRAAGAPYGISFNKMEVLANSRLALEASEFARDAEKFEEMHNSFFKAYFLDGKEISGLEQVLEIAGSIGLDVIALKKALEEGLYGERLQKVRERAMEYQVAGLPTFILGGEKKIVGAQRYEVFARAIGELKGELIGGLQ
ncbi:MAG: DsbA family oxidoreductase [Desulfocucumaceae bacterium]